MIERNSVTGLILLFDVQQRLSAGVPIEEVTEYVVETYGSARSNAADFTEKIDKALKRLEELKQLGEISPITPKR